MSTDRFIPMSPRVERMEREKAFEAGFAAALSEHESIGWWNAKRKRFVPEFSSYEIEAGLVDGYEPVYLRSVEVQSSEVPRTPEEPK